MGRFLVFLVNLFVLCIFVFFCVILFSMVTLVFNRPVVAGAVLQTPSPFIN